MSMHPRVLRAAPDPEAIAQAEAMRGVKYLPGNGVASRRLPSSAPVLRPFQHPEAWRWWRARLTPLFWGLRLVLIVHLILERRRWPRRRWVRRGPHSQSGSRNCELGMPWPQRAGLGAHIVPPGPCVANASGHSFTVFTVGSRGELPTIDVLNFPQFPAA